MERWTDRKRKKNTSTQTYKNYIENQKNVRKDYLLTKAVFSISLHNPAEN